MNFLSVLYSQLMAKLKSENAISDDLATSKFQNSLPGCKHIKVGPNHPVQTLRKIIVSVKLFFGQCPKNNK
jgi:hypothetical protein